MLTVSRRGVYCYLSNLLFRVFVGASDVLNRKEKKIGMLKIENYKNKSNMTKKTMTKIINNGKGGKIKKKTVNTCKNKTSP